MLSSGQIEQFHAFGFLVIRQAFSREEVDALIQEAAAACAQKLGRDIGEEEWFWDGEFVESRPALTRLVEDDRIYLTVTELLGDDLIWIGSEGMWGIDPKLADHTWHFDGHKTSRLLDYTRTKVMLYLDPQTKDTGALRVIPGSHRDPLHQALLPLQEAHLGGDPSPFGVDGPRIPGYSIETKPGDIVLFNQWLYHAVYGKKGKRRVIVFKFGPRPRTGAHRNMLHKGAPQGFRPHRSFLESGRPRLRRLAEGMSALGTEA
ncbi:MAG: phytanoyl-CoA dioxygenase family protein [Gemmatimonadetes bacterium]|nr:phytanoyl-CoA dioxygenase family protein [Gemmatimonadota bacterium]